MRFHMLSFSEGVAVSTLSAAATPFQPGIEKKTEEDKEAGELVGVLQHNANNNLFIQNNNSVHKHIKYKIVQINQYNKWYTSI